MTVNQVVGFLRIIVNVSIVSYICQRVVHMNNEHAHNIYNFKWCKGVV